MNMSENSQIINKEVSWTANDLQIYGTLTYPVTQSNNCGVVFIAGSGPTDRDWNSPLLLGSNGSGKLLAETLAQAGFTTLRYDKSASGPNVKENITKLMGKISMQSHLNELTGAVETLLTSGKMNNSCLFALTSSEGAVHALNYQIQAKEKPFNGLVLTGAPGRPIGAVARSQILAQVEALPNAQKIMELYDKAIADFLSGKSISPDPALPEVARIVLMSLASPANLPFTRELWTYDTAQQIGKVKEPVLVVIGKKDLQTDWQADGKALEAAAAQKSNITFIYPENANHVLKVETAPREQLTAQAITNYNSANAKLDTQTANTIINWLTENSKS